MNWNTKLGSATMPPPPPYFAQHTSFRGQPLQSTVPALPQATPHYPSSHQEACMFLSNANPAAQPLLSVRSYKAPQQSQLSDMPTGAPEPSMLPARRTACASVKPSPLGHSWQMSRVTHHMWSDSTVRTSVLSHMGVAPAPPASFGAHGPSPHALQNQCVTAEAYSAQLQLIPPPLAPPPYIPANHQGDLRLAPPSPELRGEWGEQLPAPSGPAPAVAPSGPAPAVAPSGPAPATSGLAFADCRSIPQQYASSAPGVMSDSSLQKQSPLPPMPLQVKNSEPPNSEGMLPSKAMVTGPSFHYTATQGNRRYDCRFTSQLPPLQSAQQTTKHSPADTPQARDTQAPSARNGLYRSSHQPWADRSEKDSLTGNVTVPFCDVTGCPSILSQPFIEPRRPSVMTGAPTLAPSNSEKGLGPCSQPSNSVIDTHATKESLVRDMKKLVEIKKKFSELARKIKINKDLLISAGCIKTSTSYKELTQHSALALKDTARLQPGPQVPAQILPGPPLPTQIQSRILAQIQPQILAQIPPGPQVTVVPTEKPPILLASEEAAKSSSVQEAKHRKPEPVGYISADTTCMAPAQLHGKHILTPARPSVVDIAQAAVGDAAQFPPGNPASLQQSTPGNPPLAAAPHLEQPQPLKDHTSKTSSTYKSSLLHYLLHDSSPKRGADDPVSGTQSLEPQPSTHTAGGQPDSRAEETPGTTGTPVPGSPLLAGQASSASSLAAPQGGNPCSLELLATCLSLWKKPPSEPATSGVASVEGQPVATCTRNSLLPSAEGHPEGRVPATPQNAVLVVQNHEPGGAILTKGTELQIAVVTPIILSEAKVPVPAPALEPIFPVIKEGSVCSLQDPLTKSVSTSLTACVSATSPLVSTKASPLAHKGKPDHCSNRSSEDTRPTHASHGGGLDSEPQEPSAPSSSGSSENILQIDSICSLVEGDTSYNSQIAKMFSVPPLQKAEPQTPPCSTLTEQASGHTGKRDSGPQEDGCVQGPAQPHIPAAPVAPLGPPRAEPPKQEGTDSGAAEGCMRSASEDGATGPRCSPIPQGTAVPTTSTAQDALGAGALEEEKEEVEESPDSGLDDQLLELLKEFPYGLEPACRPLPQPMPEQTPTGSATPKDASDQIQITVLSSKQMKELFPEQDEPAKPPEQGPAMEQEPATTEGHGDCPLAAATSAESPDCVIMDMEKDISCCALGWLGKIYEGVPPCHCQPAKKRKREERHPSGPGGNSEKQKEKTSRKSGHATSSQDLPCLHTKASPTAHDRKKTEEGKTGGDKAHAKHGGNCSSSSTPRTEADPRNSRKPGALHSHRSSTKWTIEQFSFHATSSTAKITQEKLQKKPCLQGTSPFKAKVSFLSSKSKDLHRKPGSLVSALTSPEKRKLKLKAGGSLQGLWGKRKREEGNGSGLASSFNKKREEHRGIVETDAPKLCLSSSSPCEPTAKEKPASLDTRPSMAAEGSSKGSRASSLEYLQRQKHKDGLRASKKNYRKISSRDSQFLRAGKLGMRPGLSKKHGGPGQSSGEPLGLNILGKSFRAYHKEPKPLSSHERGAAEPRPAEKMRADRPRGDKLASQEDTSLPAPGQAKDQRKLYLNRVGFRCTERESICLSKLEGSPQKPSRDKQQAHMEPGSPFAGREGLEKCSMLEFKLCPETLIKSVGSAEERREKACPRRERPPVQVSGIKSTKEDWLKSVAEEKMPEAKQDIDNSVVGNSRLSKRSFSANAFDTAQSSAKDSKSMFQTYKKMYMEKKSRSLGSSPVK